MASPNRKFTRNAPGHYYVDDQCIGCALCTTLAPAYFRENFTPEALADSAYVWHQPRTSTERRLCREAMQNCPVAAIGDDGLASGAPS
jgi:ferredoxin